MAHWELAARQLQLCEERCNDKVVNARSFASGCDEQLSSSGAQSARVIMVAP